jgi:hypothetical protein
MKLVSVRICNVEKNIRAERRGRGGRSEELNFRANNFQSEVHASLFLFMVR